MDQPKKRLDGISSPVFSRASEVDWQEVRSDWEELTGQKLHYSFWRGFFLWTFVVVIFVYLQVAFFELYFSKPYLAKKINNVVGLAKEIKSNPDQGASIGLLESNLNDLQTSLARKGQYFVFLSYNPLFKSQVVDLSRLILINQSLNNTKSAAVSSLKTNNPLFFKFDLWLAKTNIKQIKQTLNLINVPEFEFYKSQINPYLDQAIKQADYWQGQSDNLINVLGVGSERRYLLLFPNNKEERNWGGFSGTYGVLTLNGGKEPQIYMRDIYALDRLIRGNDVNSIAKPETAKQVPADLNPDQKIFPDNPFAWWYLRNSATSLDFSINARRAMWSYENVDKQDSVNGVIALTPDLIIDILKIIGPIAMPEYGTTITADNFRDVIENKVEFDNAFKKNIDKTKDPKQILVDLAPVFINKLKGTSLSQKIAILQDIAKNFQEKQIMTYFQNESIQNLAQNYNITGELKMSPYDYLAIYSSNLNGTKSSLDLKRNYNLSSQIGVNNEVVDDLTINLDNTDPGTGVFNYMGMDNLMEIVVPKGSQLQTVTKNDESILDKIVISEEKDKTIFVYRYLIKPQEKVILNVKYTLPKIVVDNWGFVLQKQPGIEEFNFGYSVSSVKPVIIEQGLLDQEQVIKKDQEFKLKIQ